MHRVSFGRTSIRIVNELFAALDAVQAGQNKKPITLNALKDLAQVTLPRDIPVGFGRRASWQQNASTEPPPGQTNGLRAGGLRGLSSTYSEGAHTEWLSALSERIALKLHMGELVSLSRAANMEDEDAAANSYKNLTDDELFSNTFLVSSGRAMKRLLTRWHSRSRIWLYILTYNRKFMTRHCCCGPDGAPKTASASSYGESMPRLLYTLATFHETIRLFPPVIRISKLVHADTTIKAHRFTTTSNGDIDNVQDISVPVKAGSMVLVDIRGLHMNPMYWGPDAESFKPERFIDTESYKWPRDAFLAFFCWPAGLHRAAIRGDGERVRACQPGADLRNLRPGEAAREAV
ncbi:cytochrome P450 [Mycena olivaceomarginata]|nr:cytochrome P450 [Mycena olivaceomarginata]